MKPKEETPPKKIPTVEELHTPAEVALTLKVTERVVLDLLRGGGLRGVKVGRAWRVKESDLQRFLEQSGRTKGEAPPESGGKGGGI